MVKHGVYPQCLLYSTVITMIEKEEKLLDRIYDIAVEALTCTTESITGLYYKRSDALEKIVEILENE